MTCKRYAFLGKVIPTCILRMSYQAYTYLAAPTYGATAFSITNVDQDIFRVDL